MGEGTRRGALALYLPPLPVVLKSSAETICGCNRLSLMSSGWADHSDSWVLGADMQCKLFVALQLEVAHHFIERCAGERTGLFELPPTVGATKTPKTLLLNPHQLPDHGPPMRPDCCGRCVKGRAESTMRQFGGSVGHPTCMEDFCSCEHCIICRVFDDRL
jgi:hypothetical protein